MTVAAPKRSLNKYACQASSLVKAARIVLLLAPGIISGYANASSVPVVDSTPAMAIESGGDGFPQPVSEAKTLGSEAGVAHMLNVIDQLRSDVMELRGQLEEQGYLLKQLQQENRDRYLDLDERIARLGDTSEVPAGKSRVSPGKITPFPAAGSGKTEENAYNAAFQLIRDKHFDEARQALKKQLADYPKGQYADNAQYWLGEVYMAQGNYPGAQEAFSGVLNNYPNSPKIPDAIYKLGRLSDLQGDQQQARKYLESVISKYPESAASRLSDTYLRNLGD